MLDLRKRTKKAFGAVEAVAAALFAVALIACPECCVDGVRNGLHLCAAVLIPSLFPFLAVSSFAAASSACNRILKVFSPLMRHAFRLPACAASAVIFGFIGGYPVGCSVAARLYNDGRLTAEQAQRISLFCVSAGPAFVITAVGAVMLDNIGAGIVLYASQLISGMLIGLFLSFTAPKLKKQTLCAEEGVCGSKALVEAVEKAALTMFRICAWSVLFSCFLNLLYSFGPKGRASFFITCVLEVTSGCSATAQQGNLCVLAAVLGWGGLCVGCQLLENIRLFSTPIPVFFVFRAVHAGLAAVVCDVLLKLFPIEMSVFSNLTAPSAGSLSYSVPATLALVCLSTVFVIDLDRERKMC